MRYERSYEFSLGRWPTPPADGRGALGTWVVLEIVGANLAVLGLALWQHWPMAWLLWPYWLQSALIGVFHFFRMDALKRFSTEGFSVDGQPVPTTSEGKYAATDFFALHYGFFHLFYLVALCKWAPVPTQDWGYILLGALGFGVGLALNQGRRLRADAEGAPSLGAMLFLPYLRIVPMHVAVLVGAAWRGGPGPLLLFGALKTAADVAAARWQSRLEAGSAATPAPADPEIAAAADLRQRIARSRAQRRAGR